MHEMLPVVILCGGFGTRLRPVVDDRPKVLAPVGGEPFLSHLLRHLRAQGCTDIVLSTGYLGEMIADYAGDGARWDVRVRYAREAEPLGTGGALRLTMEQAAIDGAFLAMNGDTFFSGAVKDLVVFHRERGARATLALVRVPDARRFGTVRTADSGAVEAFVEKQPGRTGAAWINAGVYVLEAASMADIPAGQHVSMERSVFPQWISKGLFGCRFPGAAFLDIGTPDDYARATRMLKADDDVAE